METITAGQIEEAERLAGWDAARAHEEFDKFRDYHREHASRFRDWPAAWRNWCRKGRQFDERDMGRERTGVCGAVSGLRDWLRRQPR